MPAILKWLAAAALAAALCSGCSNTEDIRAAGSSSAVPSQASGSLPFAEEHPVTHDTVAVELDGQSYRVPIEDAKFKQFSYAARTSLGIVWSTAPKAEPYDPSNDSPLYYLADPFILYLSETDQLDLSVKTSQELLKLPLEDRGYDYILLTGLIGVGDYVIYHTCSSFKEGGQPAICNAWAFNAKAPDHVQEVLDFHNTGGLFYSYAAIPDDGIYVGVSDKPNADGDYDHEAYAYMLATERKVTLERFAIEDGAIRFELNGKNYSAALQQG